MLGGAKLDSKWVMRKVFYLLRLRLELWGLSCRLDVAGSAMRVGLTALGFVVTPYLGLRPRLVWDGLRP